MPKQILCLVTVIILLTLCSCSDEVSSGYVQTNRSDTDATSTNAPAQSASSAVSSQPDLTSSSASSSRVSGTSSKDNTSSEVYTVSSFVGQSDDWRLLMANRNNVITNYELTVKQFDRQYCQNDVKYYFDERAFDDAMEMILAAREDGVTLVILSTYRTYQRQTELYNNKVQQYLNKGYSRENAEKHAATIVAVPGTSDHNLGLAIDFNYLEEQYENKPSLKWLRENGEKYGFVMRYPKGKENITGVTYEPWHFRYVGVEHAKKMNSLNMCLEEYVEYLSKTS